MEESTMTMTSNPVDGMKAVQSSRLRDSFIQASLNGYMTTSGIKMDAKRDDIDNLTRLRDRLAETGTDSTTIRDYDNQFHTVTIAELSEIVGELVDFGLGLFARKWELELELAATETEEEILAVRWS